MTSKNIYLSFMTKAITELGIIFFMAVSSPLSYLIFSNWSEIEVSLKIGWLFVFALFLFGAIIMPLNGMIIRKNGTVIYNPDCRIKIVKVKELKRIAFIFSEWDNSKYSVTVKLVYKNGKTFTKDYSKQFRSLTLQKRFVQSAYTISKKRVDKICQLISNLSYCHITIIDKQGEMVYQKIADSGEKQ